MQSITDAFLSGIVKFNNRVPNHINEKTKECFIDYLGVACSGFTLLDKKWHDIINRLESLDGARVIGSTKRVPETIAAMINGVNAHLIELDDGHRIGMIHLGAPIISALLAVAEKEQLSSSDFALGIVVGYEVAIRLACCVQPGCKLKGYHATGTCGTVGAAMGIAAALHFDEKQMKSTMSAAITSAAGVLEMIEGDTGLKPYNAGRAAMDGVAAAYIGMARFKAPADALGGKRGFLKVMTDNPKLEYITDFTGDKYMIEGIYMKPYAACRHCHPSIEAALHIRQQEGFDLSKIEKIQVDTYKLAVGGHDHIEIKGANSAKMSIPYSLSVALKTGKVGLDEFTEDYLNDREILSVTSMVSVKDVDELTELCPQKRVAIVTIKTTNGDYCERVDYPKGEPENPLTRQELEDKFRGLAIFGGLTQEDCDDVLTEIWKEDFSINKILDLVCRK